MILRVNENYRAYYSLAHVKKFFYNKNEKNTNKSLLVDFFYFHRKWKYISMR